ncbi:MAG: hypothetical protein NVSMB1_05400 [Polyangiales bacterium]
MGGATMEKKLPSAPTLPPSRFRFVQLLRDAYAPPAVETVMLSSMGALYASTDHCVMGPHCP